MEESEESSPASHHPDLNDEVAALSVKLVQAINNQTTLDDNLVATRQELEQAQTMVQTLELENEKYRRDIDQEVLIRKADSDQEISRLQDALAEEKAQRAAIEKGKKTIEQELETLTAALFEEANKMVAAAKLEREEVEKKNEQLRAQVKDTESLLASHQDQLAELKAVMQGMNPAKDDTDTRTIASTAPSSPAARRQSLQGMVKKNQETAQPLDQDLPAQPTEDILPGPSTSFPHLVKTVCRTEHQAFEDFRDLFHVPQSRPPSRAPSGSYSGLNVMSFANFGSGSFGSTSSSPSKSQTHSPSGSMSSPQPGSSHSPLKEKRFYKRALVEDIEPTLRLDLAPGISWLTRRTVINGICEGSLLVEPMPPTGRDPCAMCGERRAAPEYQRCHRFRTSDSEAAQRYPLCSLCLERTRSCCEFTGYLRLILDGHVRAGDSEEEKDAWEETVRLRERMFWSRVGAGVVPLYSHAPVNGLTGAQVDGLQPSILESTGVQTDAENDYHEYYNDDSDYDRASVYEDPFVSAGSASPASTVYSAVNTDQPEPLDLGQEVYESTIEQVTVSAAIQSPQSEENDAPIKQLTTQTVEPVIEKETA